MKKFITWFSVVFVITGIGIAAFWAYASQRDYFYDSIENLVIVETGYTLEKSGPAEFSLLPRPTLSYHQVVVTNPAEPQESKLGKFEQLTFTLNWLPLLSGELVVNLDIRSADLDIHVFEDGHINWMTEELQLIAAGLPFDPGKVLASNTRIQLRDHRHNDEIELQLGQIGIDFTRETGKFGLHGSGMFAGSVFKVDGDLEYSRKTGLLNVSMELAAGEFSNDNVQNTGSSSVSARYWDSAVSLPISGQITGALSIEDGLPYGTMTIDAEVGDLGDLMYLFPGSHSYGNDLGSVNGNANVQVKGRDIDIDEFEIRLNQENLNLLVRGFGRNLLTRKIFGIEVSADAKLLNNIPAFSDLVPDYLGVGIEGFDTTANMMIEGTPANFSVDDLELVFSRDNQELTLTGQLVQLPDNPLANLKFQFVSGQSMDLENLLPDLEGLQVQGPVDITGNVTVDKNQISVRDIQVLVGDSDLQGSIEANLGVSPPGIIVDLQSKNYFDEFDVLGPDPESDNMVDGDGPDEPASETEIVLSAKELGEQYRAYTSSIRISNDWIKDLDLDLKILTETAKVIDQEFDNLSIEFNVRNGIFSLLRFESLPENGSFSVQGSINSNVNPPTYTFSGKFEELYPEFLFELNDDDIEGGSLSGDFTLSSEGDTLAELLENLQGNSLLTMGPLALNSNVLTYVSSDIIHSVISGVLNKKEDTSRSKYQCAVLGVGIERGIISARKTVTLQARDYNLVGKGSVDLNTGYVDLVVSPKARKGLGLSVSTIVGGFRIRGNMATPDFKISSGGLVSTAAVGWLLAPTLATGAAVDPVTATVFATGVIATGLYDRVTASSYTCRKTLDGIQRLRSKKLKPDSAYRGRSSI